MEGSSSGTTSWLAISIPVKNVGTRITGFQNHRIENPKFIFKIEVHKIETISVKILEKLKIHLKFKVLRNFQ
jgi:hypothetical protein